MTDRESAVAPRDERALATDDPSDEPSAQWGWHGSFPRGSVIAGWITAGIFLLFLLSHLMGSHSEGLIPDIYLAGITAGMILLLIRHTVRARRSWRR